MVNQDILKDHQRKIEEAKKELVDRITLNQNKIKDTEAQIESLKKELSDKIAINENLIKIKEEKRETLENQLSDIQKEIVALQQIRETISKREIEKVDVVGMVAYFNDFQARLNSFYYTQSQIIDQIPSQIQSYKENITDLQSRFISLDGLPLKMQSYKEKIAILQGRLVNIKETKVIDPPHSSLDPVKPQKKKILAIAGIAGLLISVLLAFFLSYVEKYRESGT